MHLAVIGSSEYEKFFDKIEKVSNYHIAQIKGKKCVFLNSDNNFTSNLDIIKIAGVNKILEISSDNIDFNNKELSEKEWISYSGFLAVGDEFYIKTLIDVAINNDSQNKGETLTEREKEVLSLIGAGLTNKDIAKKLFLSEKTVKNHINNIFKKIEVTDRTNAALYAINNEI